MSKPAGGGLLFKHILTKPNLGDHVEEICFERPVRLTRIHVGSAPGDAQAYVHLFARDLTALAGSRMLCLHERIELPASGMKGLKFEHVTDCLVLRGRFQTLPLHIYGIPLPQSHPMQTDQQLTADAQSRLKNLIGSSQAAISAAVTANMLLPPPSATRLPVTHLPGGYVELLKSMLPFWALVRTKESAMVANPINQEQLAALLAAANRVCKQACTREVRSQTIAPRAAAERQAAARAAAARLREEKADELVGDAVLPSETLFDLDPPLQEAKQAAEAEAAAGAALKAEPHNDEPAADEDSVGEVAALMAAEWCSVLGGAYASAESVEYGMAGLAAAIILATSSRHAAQLLAFHSLTSLASVLDMMRPPKSTMRFAIVLAELLTRSTGAMGCEAVLGWWTPGEVPSEVVSASVVAAAGLSPRLSLAWQELVLHQQRNAAAEASAAAAAGADEREPGSPSGVGLAAANDEDRARRHKRSRRNRDERSSRRHSSRHSDDRAADLENDQPAAVRPEAVHDAGHLRQTDGQAQQPRAGSEDVAVLVKPDPDLPDSEAPMNGSANVSEKLEVAQDQHQRAAWDGSPHPADSERGADRSRRHKSRRSSRDREGRSSRRDRDRPREHGSIREPAREAGSRDKQQEQQKDPTEHGNHRSHHGHSREVSRADHDAEVPSQGRPAEEAELKRERSGDVRAKAEGDRARGLSKESSRSLRRGKSQDRNSSRDCNDRDRQRRDHKRSRSKHSHSPGSPEPERKRSRHTREVESDCPVWAQPGDRSRPASAAAEEPLSADALLLQTSLKQGLTVVRPKQVPGCYAPLVDKLLDQQPAQVSGVGITLLQRLTFYQTVTDFATAADKLLAGIGTGDDTEQLLELSERVALLEQAGRCLSKAADQLLTAGAGPATPHAAVIQAMDAPTHALTASAAFDAPTLAALGARHILQSLAALLHSPSVLTQQLQASNQLPAHVTAQQVQAAQMRVILPGAQNLIAALLSTPTGLVYLLQNYEAAQALASALESAKGTEATAVRSDGHASPAAALQCTMSALMAARELAAMSSSTDDTAQTGSMLHILTLVDSMAPAGRQAVALALAVVPGALQSLLNVLKASTLQSVLPASPPNSMLAAQLLLQVVSEPHSNILARWTGLHPYISSAISVALQHASSKRLKQMLHGIKGRAEAASILSDQGLTSLLHSLASTLPPLTSTSVKGVKEVDGKACVQLMATADRGSMLICGLQLAAGILERPQAQFLGTLVAEADGLQVTEQALRMGTALVHASDADGTWAHLCGDLLDDAEVIRNRQLAASFLLAAARLLGGLLEQLENRSIKLHSISLMDAMLAAHAATCAAVESLVATKGLAQGNETMLQARKAMASTMKTWFDNTSWRPKLVTAAFVGAKVAASERIEAPFQAARSVYTSLCLLGDLFPAEWPPPQARRGAPHPPPTHRPYRIALCNALEPVLASFKSAVAMAVQSESRVMRAVLVRLCARAAGLGGGLGRLLAEPILKAMQESTEAGKNLSEARRVLEMVVPLAYRPPLKAAFLDLKVAGLLGQLLGRLVPILDRGVESMAVCTMVLEVILILMDPEACCLNPGLDAAQRVVDETPTIAEAAHVAAVLMASLSRLGANAHIARRILKNLAMHAPGRATLRTGAAKWQAQATGSDFAAAVGSRAALEWAASRLWAAAEEQSYEESIRAIYTEMASLLDQAAALEEGPGEGEDTQPTGAAPLRFAAAVKAAVAEGASGADGRNDASNFLRTLPPLSIILDPATNTFWRNIAARSGSMLVQPWGKAPALWQPWDGADVGPMTQSLPYPLTARKVPHDSRMGKAKAKSLTSGAPAAAGASPADSLGGAGSGSLAPAKLPSTRTTPSNMDMPGADLPPVLAPPSRPRARQPLGRTLNSTGRPASMHVDDFEKSAATPPAQGSASLVTLSPAAPGSAPGALGGGRPTGRDPRQAQAGAGPAQPPSGPSPAEQQALFAALMQGGPALQSYLEAHPQMRMHLVRLKQQLGMPT